jgi:maltooligosyltrehalose trehalohydrolase
LNDPRVIRAREAGGYGIDAHLAGAMEEAFAYAGTHSAHRQRTHGRQLYDVPGGRLVAAAQNHDQVGNRATGERLSHLGSMRRAKVAAALLLISPFVPLLFQGKEWGASSPFQYFTVHEDPELGRQMSQGRRKEFDEARRSGAAGCFRRRSGLAFAISSPHEKRRNE